MDRKWMIVACFFSILTFISSVICSSLIFYNEKNRTEINSEKVLASNNTYKNTSIVYNENSTINFSNVSSGYSVSRSFSVTNHNSNAIKYKVEWNNIVSTWAESNPEELTYSLSCTNGEKVSKQVPTQEKDYLIIDDVELKTNSTNTCTITVVYKAYEEYTGEEQEEHVTEENKSFGGKYQVKIIE